MKRVATLVVLACTAVVGGCRGGGNYGQLFRFTIGPSYDLSGPLLGAVTDVLMEEIPSDTAFPMAANVATVVFIRPSRDADALIPIVLDQQGRFLGQSLPSSYFVATLPPGDHVLTICNDKSAGMRARLSAGKRYFVELSHEESFSRRVVPSVIRQGSESWGRLTKWYTQKKRVVEKEGKGERYLQAHAELVQKCLRAGKDDVDALDATELRARSPAPEDGQ